MRAALVEGREVSLSRIGVLAPYQAKGRAFLHPKTRERIHKPSRVRIRFRTSDDLDEVLS